ncbi:MAG: DUF1501 domain-containing protein [Polyangiaceae bacterium]
MSLTRRRWLQLACGGALSGAAAGVFRPFLSAFAGGARTSDEFFVFIQAAGGWDVTLWSDPRHEKRGIIDPATTENLETSPLKRWTDSPLAGGARSFKPVTPAGTPFVLGPAIGDLVDIADRLTLVNGIAMNTVSHPDGTLFSATGRHPVAGRAVASSVDTMIANELGRERLFPTLSVGYPSYHVGADLDPRVVPLRVGSIDAVTRLLSRAEAYETTADRGAVTAVLTEEANDLAARSSSPETMRALALQYEALQGMIGGSLESVFNVAALKKAHPELPYDGKYTQTAAVAASFAVEAMKKNLVRCVSFTTGGLDTHTTNYRSHGMALQELFDLVTSLVRALDKAPHPTRTSDKLSDHAHILITSEFCRTPQLNQAGGRDHYPNNSALIVSPRFRHPFVIGSTDVEQLLPASIEGFSDGPRPIGPPDVLRTFVSAFGIDPRRYLRDGEVMRGLLKT